MLLLTEEELRRCVDMAAAIDAVEQSFARLARGEATLPPPVGLDIAAVRGEVHVKGAHLHGSETFTFKVAAGFYDNPSRGLPTGSGLMLVFDATSGFPAALLLDNAWLTDLRTGAAGGVAARYLAPPQPRHVVVVGAGVQARLQLQALAEVRPLRRISIWNHHRQRAVDSAAELRGTLAEDVRAAEDLEAAVRDADLVITCTPSRKPLVRAAWLQPGTHVTAVGSDGPDKLELEPAALGRADRVFADRLDQCARLGEIHHALDAGVMQAGDVAGELGDLVIGRVAGRQGDEITVADLTGVGVQDAAIAELALRQARAAGLGKAWP